MRPRRGASLSGRRTAQPVLACEAQTDQAIWRLYRLLAVLGLTALLCALAMTRPHAATATLLVKMDKALVLKYPPETETIVIGNPVVADVTMVRNSGVVVVTGKGFGETNLVFLDRAGSLLSETNLRVDPPGGTLVVQSGTSRYTYSCHPRCEPMIAIGDDSTFLRNAASDISARNGAATPSGGSSSSGGMSTPH